jgi:hypothetical protein
MDQVVDRALKLLKKRESKNINKIKEYLLLRL